MVKSDNGKPKKVAEAAFPTTEFGDFTIVIYTQDTKEHVALIKGKIDGSEDMPVRIQSECLPGTALDYAGCDCAEQIRGSFELISHFTSGVFLYMREEGRGHGLATKILAMVNKNKGLDTFKALEVLGLKPDLRDYKTAVQILKELKIFSIRLITNNPEKVLALEKAGIPTTGRIPIEVAATPHTRIHLRAKKHIGHHLLQDI